ncbi:MAG: hypothetical protein AAB091_02255 [Elusimicrobiota bacterium]
MLRARLLRWNIFLPALILFSGACAPRLAVWRPDLLRQTQTVAVLPICVGKTQREYSELYFPSFYKGFSKKFAGRFKIVGADDLLRTEKNPPAANSDSTWDAALEAGKKLNADIVIGILIDDSDHPGKLIEIIKAAKPSNEKIAAGGNWLLTPKDNYTFSRELKSLEAIFKR